MARERVLVIPGRSPEPTALAELLRAITAQRSWPSIMLVAGVEEPLSQIDQTVAAIAQDARVTVVEAGADLSAATLGLVHASEADSILLLDEHDDGLFEAAKQAAIAFDIPLWAPTAGEAAGQTVTAGDASFSEVRIERPVEAVRPSKTGGFWFSTLAALLLALVVGVAGTFSYLSMPPVGIIVAALAVAGLLVGARASVPYRTPSAVAAVVLLVTVMFLAVDPLSSAGSQGSVLIPASPLGWTWVGIVALGSFATLAMPDFSALRRSRMEVREGAAK